MYSRFILELFSDDNLHLNVFEYMKSVFYLQDVFNKTWYPKAKDHINTEKTWYIVDATNKVLGRLASTIAIHIRGKNLATYTPSVDMGAYVIVVSIII